MNNQHIFVHLQMEVFLTFLSNPQIVDLVIIVFCTVSTQIQKPFELSRCHSFLTPDLCKLNESSATHITGHEGSLLRILIITSLPVHNSCLFCIFSLATFLFQTKHVLFIMPWQPIYKKIIIASI